MARTVDRSGLSNKSLWTATSTIEIVRVTRRRSNLREIEHAVLETDGAISVIPRHER